MDFAVKMVPRVKTKENEKFNALIRELEKKKLWAINVHIFVAKSLKKLEELEISEEIETMEITTSLRSTRILGKVLETWGDLLPHRIQSNIYW